MKTTATISALHPAGVTELDDQAMDRARGTFVRIAAVVAFLLVAARIFMVLGVRGG